MLDLRTVTIEKEVATIALRTDKFEIPLFNQIFGSQVFSLERLKRANQFRIFYGHAVQMGWTPLIIDLGANIGLSSIYFSMIWPKAKIVAVEPEENNYEQLVFNSREREQIVSLRKAASCCHEIVEIVNPDTDPVGFQTRTNSNGEITTITVQDILDMYSIQKKFLPFLVKIDIEGYEEKLFESNYDWIDLFPVIIIELHDWALPTLGTSKNFIKAISGKDRDFVFIGENIFSLQNQLQIPVPYSPI